MGPLVGSVGRVTAQPHQSATLGLTASVVVPSYRRPATLLRCLAGLELQTHRADEVLVVVRHSDLATADVVRRAPPTLAARVVWANAPGLVAALNLGLASARTDVVAFVDDDAVPVPEWLARILRYYESASVGAVGGRDVVAGASAVTPRARVGHLHWYGKVTGGHHSGGGPARDVHVLKGANMSVRRAAVGTGFDTRLRGYGAQVHNEETLFLAMVKAGWRVVYAPAIVVHHYPEVRPAGDKRDSNSAKDVANAVHNRAIAILDNVSFPRRVAFLTWAALIGTASEPGWMQVLRLLARTRGRVLAMYYGTLAGLAAGIRAHRSGGGHGTIPPPPDSARDLGDDVALRVP